MRKMLGLLTALVLMGLIAMTLARFVDTGVRLPILLASFSGYAVLGFLVVLVGAALALRRTQRRRWVLVFAAIAGLGLVVQGSVLAPLYVGGASGRPALTVMTSNLEFGRGDAATVVRTAAADKVDVLVLEEVTPTALEELDAAGLHDLLPHRQGAPSRSAAGTMAFSHYRLESPKLFEQVNGGLDLQVQAPTPFRLLAVHAAQPVGWPGPWLTDMDRVRERAVEAVASGPTLVVGDFNATRDHEPLRKVLDTGLRDAAEQAGSGWQPTWPSRYGPGWLRPLIAIDHVLSTKHFEAVRTHTVQVPRTDHLALVAQLRVG
jgi:endonuclease/exonuclease/phosphatase family metal-dependent hydrolase